MEGDTELLSRKVCLCLRQSDSGFLVDYSRLYLPLRAIKLETDFCLLACVA